MATSHILDNPGTVLIDDRGTDRTYVLINPVETLVARSPHDVARVLDCIDSRLARGLHVAGYLGYEAGLALDKPIDYSRPPSFPLAWFGVYERCRESAYDDADLPHPDTAADVTVPELSLGREDYLGSVRRIKDYISAGDVYQVNYTCKLRFEHSQPASRLFARLRRAHPVGYSAFINTGEFQVVSISPELFMSREQGTLLTRPMKGTAKRGRWSEEDAEVCANLAHDEKNRAENLMILDLMRNDLGRVCATGSVNVPRMFHVEGYRSVFQMTSDVEGRADSVSASTLLRATFPPGSVTGAPKIRALEIINELESEAREVYCGSIGMFRPNGDLQLNVAIRTIVQDGTHCEMGVGSGIVADSDPEEELRETLLKGEFVLSEPVEFELLETLLYRASQGYAFAESHIKRMCDSADYFGWSVDEAAIRAKLQQAATEIDSSPDMLRARVRLLLSQDGAAEVRWSDAGPENPGPVKLRIASRRTDPSDIFLYHKTTRRQAYDADLAQARADGYFEVLYLNTRGELTECATTNIMLELDGEWYTPPLASGLLPGVWRAQLLAEGQVTERVLYHQDLCRATSIVIGNSVRGGIPVDHGDRPPQPFRK